MDIVNSLFSNPSVPLTHRLIFENKPGELAQRFAGARILKIVTDYMKGDPDFPKQQKTLIDYCVEHFDRDLFQNKMELEMGISHFELRPIHLVALKGSITMLNLLHDLGVNLSPVDSAYWSPMHYAGARGDKVMHTALMRAGADFKLTNLRNGTSNDLLRMATPPENPARIQVSEYVNGAVQSRSAFDVLGPDLNYGEYVHTPSRYLLQDRFEPFFIKGNSWHMADLARSKYAEYCSRARPRVAIADFGSAGKGIRAAVPLRAGDIAFEFCGEHVDKATADKSDYALQGIDPDGPLKMRSAGGLCQDGPPNLLIVKVANLAGRTRALGIMLEDAAVGKEVCIDYGPRHGVKQESYIRFRYEELQAFFRKYPIDNDLFTIMGRHIRDLKTLEEIRVFCYVAYLSNTPAVALSLILDGTIPPWAHEHFGDSLLSSITPDIRHFILNTKDLPNPVKSILYSTFAEFIPGMDLITIRLALGSIESLVREFKKMAHTSASGSLALKEITMAYLATMKVVMKEKLAEKALEKKKA